MSHILPIRSAEKRNFQTLVSAIEAGHACLMSAYDTSAHKTAVLVCAVNHNVDHPEPYEFVPLAMLCDGDPYSRFVPPTATNPLQTPMLKTS